MINLIAAIALPARGGANCLTLPDGFAHLAIQTEKAKAGPPSGRKIYPCCTHIASKEGLENGVLCMIKIIAKPIIM